MQMRSSENCCERWFKASPIPHNESCFRQKRASETKILQVPLGEDKHFLLHFFCVGRFAGIAALPPLHLTPPSHHAPAAHSRDGALRPTQPLGGGRRGAGRCRRAMGVGGRAGRQGALAAGGGVGAAALPARQVWRAACVVVRGPGTEGLGVSCPREG